MKMSETVLDSKYLKGPDVAKQKLVTIKDVFPIKMGLPGEPEQEKAVVQFDELGKGLVLNKTNARFLSDAFGDDTESWIGEQIVLFKDRASYMGKVHEVVRVRLPVKKDTAPAESVPPPSAGAPITTEDTDSEIPF